MPSLERNVQQKIQEVAAHCNRAEDNSDLDHLAFSVSTLDSKPCCFNYHRLLVYELNLMDSHDLM